MVQGYSDGVFVRLQSGHVKASYGDAIHLVRLRGGGGVGKGGGGGGGKRRVKRHLFRYDGRIKKRQDLTKAITRRKVDIPKAEERVKRKREGKKSGNICWVFIVLLPSGKKKGKKMGGRNQTI